MGLFDANAIFLFPVYVFMWPNDCRFGYPLLTCDVIATNEFRDLVTLTFKV